MLDPGARTELDKPFRLMRIVSFGIFGSLPILVLAVEVIKIRHAPFRGFDPGPELAVVRYVVFALCLAIFPLAGVLRSAIITGNFPFPPPPIVAGPHAALLHRLRGASVLALACCEVVAMFGFVLFLMGGTPWTFTSSWR